MFEPTPPLVLTIQGSDKVVAYACGACRFVQASEQDAWTHCAPYSCTYCQVEVARPHRTACDTCEQKNQQARALTRHQRARKIPLAEYKGDYLACDCCDEFFADEVELFEAHGGKTPTWAWATHEAGLRLDASDVVSAALERDEHHEDAFEGIPAAEFERLQAYLNGWCKCVNVRTCFADFDTAVTFEAEAKKWREELDAEEQGAA